MALHIFLLMNGPANPLGRREGFAVEETMKQELVKKKEIDGFL